MKDVRKFYKFEPKKIKTDRLAIMGRRGTGKSTGVKKAIAEEGLRVLWVVDSKELAESLVTRFVPPAVRDILPEAEEIIDSFLPSFNFGAGTIKAITWRQIKTVRDTGIDVAGKQADLIIRDEALRIDGYYQRAEPQLLDDLAGTLGRSGKMPKVVIIGNPQHNRQPYSYGWHVNVLVEGVYTDGNRTTKVIGTAACCDCFGRQIGQDPEEATYAKTLNSGGQVVTVDGVGLRLREIAQHLYVGKATPNDKIIVNNDRWTMRALSPAGTKFLVRCRNYLDMDHVIFDSFDSELTFYKMLRLRE